VQFGPYVILTLKVAVAAVTVLFLSSLVALAKGRYRLHGRINLAFAILTLVAVLGLEAASRVIYPWVSGDEKDLFSYFDEATRAALRVHLCFSVPAALVLLVMLSTGLTHHRRLHVATGVLFALLWVGTFVTGIFFLPHVPPRSSEGSEPAASARAGPR
jgi:hypothetical protein